MQRTDTAYVVYIDSLQYGQVDCLEVDGPMDHVAAWQHFGKIAAKSDASWIAFAYIGDDGKLSWHSHVIPESWLGVHSLMLDDYRSEAERIIREREEALTRKPICTSEIDMRVHDVARALKALDDDGI